VKLAHLVTNITTIHFTSFELFFAMAGSGVGNKTAFILILLATEIASDGAGRFTVAVGQVSHQSLFPRVHFRTVWTLVV